MANRVKVRGNCGVVGCDVKAYSRFRGAGPELCSRHYQQVQKLGMVLEYKDGAEMEEFVPNFLPPVVVHHSKRCVATLTNGTRCPRKKSRASFCSAHHQEQVDREKCAIRERPLEVVGGDFLGHEDELVQHYGG